MWEVVAYVATLETYTICTYTYVLFTCTMYKIQVGTEGDLEIKAYYAGHVLGAAMFLVRVRDQSIVYTVSPVSKA